jgi:UDP-4-amino-4,6-dideoxy-N-acetyl-beta-L-altrosamine transaminase
MIKKYIPYSTQDINDDDIDAVIDVLRSRFVTQGPAIERFERKIADYCGVEHAVAVSSGTAGLHIALAALGIGPGSRVWTSPNSFVASANAARYLNAEVDFVDIDIETGNVSLSSFERKLETARKNGTLPDLFLPVHYAGRPCDMDAIQSLCTRHNVKIVEDAAHALGAAYASGEKVGCARHSDATVFSFHPVKSLTTGEGGIVTTANEALARKLELYRSHGVTRDPAEFVVSDRAEPSDAWYYEQTCLGFNYRITDIQAALGASQLDRLDTFIAARRDLAARYSDVLRDMPLHLPPKAEASAWHLYVIRLSRASPISRKFLFDALRKAKIGVNVHYIPIHLQPYYRDLGFKRGDFSNAEAFYDTALSLPIFPTLDVSEQDYVVETLRHHFRNSSDA